MTDVAERFRSEVLAPGNTSSNKPVVSEEKRYHPNADDTTRISGNNKNTNAVKPEIPWYLKYSLSVIEAAAYAGIGKNKMYSLVHEHSTAPWIFMNGTEHRIKRKLFEEFLDQATAL